MRIALWAASIAVFGALLSPRMETQQHPTAKLTITAVDLLTGLPITQGETLHEGAMSVQATVTGAGQACIGSLIASEGSPFWHNGIPLALPSGGFYAVPFQLNSNGFSNSFTAGPVYPANPNFKITVTFTSACNGVIGVSGTVFQFYDVYP